MPGEKLDSTSKQHHRFSDVIWRGTQAMSLLAFFSFSHFFGIFFFGVFRDFVSLFLLFTTEKNKMKKKKSGKRTSS